MVEMPGFWGETDGRGFSTPESLRASQEIDERLVEHKKVLEKKKNSIQILLLGQSESGKSSVLKNFQLAFAPKRFEEERIVWKTIVQLNLIRSVKTILESLQSEWESTDDPETSQLNRNLRRIRLGLSPLLFVESNILQLISSGSHKYRDVYVRPGCDWKAVLKSRVMQAADGARNKRRSRNPMTKEYDPTSILAASKDDIMFLWNDPGVQAVLRKQGIRIEDMPGFFLNDIARIADINYVPTDRDIMRARIRSLGVEEHHFIVEKGLGVGSDIYVTDVGGRRSQRPKWISYFEHIQTIVFLAPLAFNQTLEEAPEVNRLEDSLTLWQDICRNRLLANATLIVFFNKKDILSATLATGVMVNKYVPSFGDRPNEVAAVTKYFCDKFRAYHRKLSPFPRTFMFYETSAIDTSSMAALLVRVRETILRLYIQQGSISEL
ncbi:Guanine nucleotide-binding protein alpha-2 subunit [Hypsizygus marmoreus]|uniref:Guanine nucleotide-binding protein alpha-2 subunit n=1 Tax=Hypsizygus marmoreus TaxID=39966 RepID=A0A369JHK7_HYPMA|nr:Guanine nucleotide-binding protein alpha-2 subunit [Hypsizygus marmoreus]